MSDERRSPRPAMRRGRLTVWCQLGLTLLLLLTLTGRAFEPTPVAAATDLNVNSLDDENDGNCNATHCSLREAIAYAAPGDAIVISASGTITLTHGELVIDKNLTILGVAPTHVTVSGGDRSRVFHVTSGTVVIRDLTIAHGLAALGDNGYGAGVRQVGGMLTLQNCVITDNTATTAGGGGIYVGGGSLTLTGTTVKGNKAGYEASFGGGGAGLYVDDYHSPVSVSLLAGSKVQGNVATNSDGGGLATKGYGHGLTVLLNGSTVESNHTNGGDGAGIAVDGGLVTLLKTAVSGNSVQGQSGNGGGLAIARGEVTLEESTIGLNEAFAGGGVALIVESADAPRLSVNTSLISANRATTGAGGGIVSSGGTVTITRSTIAGNSAASGGGVALGGSTATITNSTIGENHSLGDGGGLYVVDSTLVASFATIAYNKAGDGGQGAGGGIFRGGRSGAALLRASIIAGNTDQGNQKPDCAGTVTSQDFNIIGGSDCFQQSSLGHDFALAGSPWNIQRVITFVLEDNGGPTRTYALVDVSRAINRVLDNCPATDQRGVTRPQGNGCDIGAVEGNLVPLTVTIDQCCDPYYTGNEIPSSGGYSSAQGTTIRLQGATVTLTAVVGAGYHLVSWTIDGKASGWAKEITLTMDTAHTVIATFRTGTSFSDLPETNVARQAVLELAARNTVRGYSADICAERGLAAPCFGPDDSTLRAQMAALIARAMGWDAEDWRNDFADRGPIDADLWRNVGTLAHYNVARGYGDGSYDPTGPVLSAQTISFITRSMVAKGYWVQQNDDPALYPNIPASSGHRADIATYVHYAGALPDAPVLTNPFVAWDQASTRGWFARALWQALDAHFGSDRPDTGGFVP